MSDFLEVNLVQTISDDDLEEMLKVIEPIAPNGVNTRTDGSTWHKMHVVDIRDADRRNTAYLWAPKFGREVHVAYGNGAVALCPTFHYSSICFKPSLAEVYASVRAFVPEWRKAKFLWLNYDLTERGPMMWNNVKTTYMACAHLFDVDFMVAGNGDEM